MHGRICKECYEDKLEFRELEYSGTGFNGEYGAIVYYFCPVCGMVDIWLEEEQIWIRDYE